MNPLVSFVVPCYNLAHLLPECIRSILDQTYTNFEILVMDDQSPDNTAEVAASFNDPRVVHIRNEKNLGHLRNYNKGIGMSRGKYVWLISADDCLRRCDALERYVSRLEANDRIGYIFSPAARLENGVRGEVLDYSILADQDTVWNGRQFLHKLVMQNTIVAPSVLVRKECYERVSLFPLDMPWGGDWYLWCVFAMEFDVAYIAEPMVYYRRHTLSMTNQLTTQTVQTCVEEDLAMPWIIKKKADELGFYDLAPSCLASAAQEYVRNLTCKHYRTATSEAKASLTFAHMEASLASHGATSHERTWIRARVYVGVADWYSWEGNLIRAREFYGKALMQDFWMPKVWMKALMLLAGNSGMKLRAAVAALRSSARMGSRVPSAHR